MEKTGRVRGKKLSLASIHPKPQKNTFLFSPPFDPGSAVGPIPKGGPQGAVISFKKTSHHLWTALTNIHTYTTHTTHTDTPHIHNTHSTNTQHRRLYQTVWRGNTAGRFIPASGCQRQGGGHRRHAGCCSRPAPRRPPAPPAGQGAAGSHTSSVLSTAAGARRLAQNPRKEGPAFRGTSHRGGGSVLGPS